MNQKMLYREFATLKDGGFPLEDFDPICEALDQYQKKHRQAGYPGRVLPNRLVALAAVQFMEQNEHEAWEA